MLLRSLILAAALACGAASAGTVEGGGNAVLGPLAHVLGAPTEIISVRHAGTLIMAFGVDGHFTLGDGVTPEQAALEAFQRGPTADEFCANWQAREDVEARDEPVAATIYFVTVELAGYPDGDEGRRIQVDAHPDGSVAFQGFDPTPEARRFFHKMAEIEKCSG